ncbi:UNVERIFIED_CONTAM: hypothetical protein HDU68_011723 [Siphonaria sp. JEL0065]|nr:hypothetical protein HDU68_011723 [Siphonaria sp. JEL0065]
MKSQVSRSPKTSASTTNAAPTSSTTAANGGPSSACFTLYVSGSTYAEWKLLGACSPSIGGATTVPTVLCYAKFNPTFTYSGNNQVSYENVNYHNTYYTGTALPINENGWVKEGPLEYYSRKQNGMQNWDLSKFTTINYAFMNADDYGNLVAFDSYADGINIPILNGPEYPGGGDVTCNSASPDDAKNFATLLAALRTELGPRRSISIAVSAETDHYISGGINYIPQYFKSVNYLPVMTYDFYGSWVPNSDFNSPLDLPKASDPQQPAANNVGYNGHGITQMPAMRNWLAAEAPATQLTNGLAFYGRSWSVQSSANNGLYQLCTGSVNGGSCAGVVGDYLDAQSWCGE